jgi:hypothetical protein
VSLFLLMTRNISITVLTSFPFVAEEDTDDEDFDEASEADVSLEGSFEHIDEDELEDIEKEQQETMPTPRPARKKTVPAARKKSPMKDLEERLEKSNLKEVDDGTSFTIVLPKAKYVFREGRKDVVMFEFVSLLPPECLRHCKVLPGGKHLSVLFGFPRELTSGRAGRKLLEAKGIIFNANLAQVTARATQVEHHVNTNFDNQDPLCDGDPQVIKLPFVCEEGPVTGANLSWNKWRKKGSRVEFRNAWHDQFYDLLELKIVSQHTYTNGHEESVHNTLDDSDYSGDEDDDDDDMAGL